MIRNIQTFILVCALTLFALPVTVSAAGLTATQANAIIGLLQAFGATSSVIENVRVALGLTAAASTTPVASTTAPYVPVTDSIYPKSGIGFDLSYNTYSYPATNFSFAVVGVTGGKAFTTNSRIVSEYAWGKFASHASPTVYVNINAPYGSSVAGHISAPKVCPTRDSGTAPVGVGTPANTSSGVTGAVEPNACEAYNYGYQTASSAYAYAMQNSVSSPIWWLDIEEANSWSSDTTVNDAVIQGAIDFLNTKDIPVGLYSVPYMWRNIAGTSFVPTQTVRGASVATPTWFPIGTATQVGAINACLSARSFITGSPVWIIQYEADSTAIDQNIAC